jgi:hypothetical protein
MGIVKLAAGPVSARESEESGGKPLYSKGAELKNEWPGRKEPLLSAANVILSLSVAVSAEDRLPSREYHEA